LSCNLAVTIVVFSLMFKIATLQALKNQGNFDFDKIRLMLVTVDCEYVTFDYGYVTRVYPHQIAPLRVFTIGI
jgi:hypothetical protein